MTMAGLHGGWLYHDTDVVLSARISQELIGFDVLVAKGGSLKMGSATTNTHGCLYSCTVYFRLHGQLFTRYAYEKQQSLFIRLAVPSWLTRHGHHHLLQPPPQIYTASLPALKLNPIPPNTVRIQEVRYNSISRPFSTYLGTQCTPSSFVRVSALRPRHL